jgi:signal transduction histidine kinase
MFNKVEHYVDEAGQSHWVNTTKAPRYDADGEPIGIVGGTRDITEEKRQEHMVRAVHEASRDLVRAGDRAEIGEVTVAIAEDIPALPRVQVALVDATTGELSPVNPDGAASVYDRYAEWYQRAADSGETLFVLDDGADATTDRAFSADPVAVVIPLGDHGVLGATTGEQSVDEFTVDLANILAANVEAALDRAERERELERQNERLEEFASIVSHDLRNPISVLEGSLTLARETGDDEQFDRCYRAIDRMKELIEDRLTLAREGEAVSETEPLDLESTVESCWRAVETADASLEITSESTIYADESRTRQLFENLINNAVTHGGPNVTVTVGDLGESGFYVADDGPGIPSEKRDTVFESGYTTSEDGTGFGLAIVKEIAAAHDWSVSVTESDTGGARFEFTGVMQAF